MEIKADDIITAMECHRINACHRCPYEGIRNCIEYLCDDAVSLVKRLGEEKDQFLDTIVCLEIDLEKAKANAVRKMQAEIINRCIHGGIYPAFVATTIDKIAKEMIDNV